MRAYACQSRSGAIRGSRGFTSWPELTLVYTGIVIACYQNRQLQWTMSNIRNIPWNKQ
jgi:hypothetical protein